VDDEGQKREERTGKETGRRKQRLIRGFLKATSYAKGKGWRRDFNGWRRRRIGGKEGGEARREGGCSAYHGGQLLPHTGFRAKMLVLVVLLLIIVPVLVCVWWCVRGFVGWIWRCVLLLSDDGPRCKTQNRSRGQTGHKHAHDSPPTQPHTHRRTGKREFVQFVLAAKAPFQDRGRQTRPAASETKQ